MIETGKKLSFSGVVADKHSIGGMPGTRTTLIIVPIIAAAGYLIPKTSSRAITTPAGTSDCMEILAEVDFTVPELTKIVNKTGGCIVWNQKLGLAPADDIIIRVEEPLAFESFDKVMISILAKKVAAGAKIMILDIPVGPTMKIKYVKDALVFGANFTKLASRFNLKVKTEVNYQLEPTGRGIGPALEVVDALAVLEQQPDRPLALEQKALKIASRLLDMCYLEDNQKIDGLRMAEEILHTGKALTKFKEIIVAQRGDPTITSQTVKRARYKKEIFSPASGVVSLVDNYNITAVAKALGAPQVKTAGLIIHKHFNKPIKKDDLMLELFAEDEKKMDDALLTLKNLPVYEIKTT
jgi:AMP phosphorylase